MESCSCGTPLATKTMVFAHREAQSRKIERKIMGDIFAKRKRDRMSGRVKHSSKRHRNRMAADQTIMGRFLNFLRRNEPIFEFQTNENREDSNLKLTDEEFVRIFHELEEYCDECDTDLKDAISYSLRMMEQQKARQNAPGSIKKLKTTDVHELSGKSEENLPQIAPGR